MKYLKLIVLIVLFVFFMLKAGEMAMSEHLQPEVVDQDITVKYTVHKPAVVRAEYVQAKDVVQRDFDSLQTHERVQAAYDYMDSQNVSTEIQYMVQELIARETKSDPFNQSARPITEIYHCDRVITFTLWGRSHTQNAIEMHDKAGGRYQATCEDYGATTLYTTHSKGLLQITDDTWSGYSCQGNPYNWQDNIDCGVRIIEMDGGCHKWSTCY